MSVADPLQHAEQLLAKLEAARATLEQTEEADAALERLYTSLLGVPVVALQAPTKATERFVTAMDDDFSGAHFAPGPTHLNGQQALQFSRDRYDFSDIVGRDPVAVPGQRRRPGCSRPRARRRGTSTGTTVAGAAEGRYR